MNENYIFLNNKDKNLNESALAIIGIILSLPFLIFGGFVGVTYLQSVSNYNKKQKLFKQHISTFINLNELTKRLSQEIKSIKSISLYELCKYLNVKDYKSKFPKSNYENLEIKGIFNNDKLIAYGLLISNNKNAKMNFGIIDSKYKSDKNCSILIQTLLEYHFHVIGEGYSKMIKILGNAKIDNSNKKQVKKFLDKKSSSNKVPNISIDEFNRMIEQNLKLINELNSKIKSSKLFKDIYSYSLEENLKEIKEYTNKIKNIKEKFNNGEIIKNYDIEFSFELFSYEYSYRNLDTENNYEDILSKIYLDFKSNIISKTFKNVDYYNFIDEKNYPYIKINYNEYNGGECILIEIIPKKEYFLKQDMTNESSNFEVPLSEASVNWNPATIRQNYEATLKAYKKSVDKAEDDKEANFKLHRKFKSILAKVEYNIEKENYNKALSYMKSSWSSIATIVGVSAAVIVGSAATGGAVGAIAGAVGATGAKKANEMAGNHFGKEYCGKFVNLLKEYIKITADNAGLDESLSFECEKGLSLVEYCNFD